MKVLVACEFSGIVREAFRKKGYYALSCDLLPSEIPGEHYQGDVFDLPLHEFDMMIAHPPCTYLTNTANKWLRDQPKRKSGVLVGEERRKARLEAFSFFMKLRNAPVRKICIENPVGIISTLYGKPQQIIQPFQFGHPQSKRTCLWLKNLPKLAPTKIVEQEDRLKLKSGKTMPGWYSMRPEGRSKNRSVTFQGIADAMAEQWG